MDHQRIRLTKNQQQQQQILYRRGWWLKYLWWEKYYVMSKIFINSHLPCLYASFVHILWTLLMLSPTARLKSDLWNKILKIYFPIFLSENFINVTYSHLIWSETVTRVFFYAGHKLWPRFRKEDTKKVMYKHTFSLCFPTHLQTWSTSSLAAGKTYRGSSSKGSASLMQVLRVSVLQSSRPPLWLLTRPGKENCISPHWNISKVHSWIQI